MNRFTLLCLPVLLLSACETTETTKPRHLSTTRGLQEEAGNLGNKALVRTSDPRVLSKYHKVIVEKVRVDLPKHPDPKVERASQSEARQLAQRFEEILREEFRAHYQITSRRGRDTLAVRATLTELQPSKPGVFVLNYLPYVGTATAVATLSSGKTLGAGSTTVEAEVVDSYSRRQVYALVDRFSGTRFQPGGLDRWGQTESAMRSWSRKIRSGIEKAAPKSEQSQSVQHSGQRRTVQMPTSLKGSHVSQNTKSANQAARIGADQSANARGVRADTNKYSRIQSR